MTENDTLERPDESRLDAHEDTEVSYIPPMPEDEADRLEVLRSYDVLDTPPEENFDSIARLAARICETPAALVTLVDEDRQWFKARVGWDDTEGARDEAFCAHSIMAPEPFVINDTAEDPRFLEHPAVTGDPGIKFYAGVPVAGWEGSLLGTLCVIDYVPRELTERQLTLLRHLARQVEVQLELIREERRLRTVLNALDEHMSERDRLFAFLQHRCHGLLAAICSDSSYVVDTANLDDPEAGGAIRSIAGASQYGNAILRTMESVQELTQLRKALNLTLPRIRRPTPDVESDDDAPEPPIPPDEERRIQMLEEYEILETETEEDFDAMVQLACGLCEAPASLLTFIDQERYWLKAYVGADLEREGPRRDSICAWTVAKGEPFVVEDLEKDAELCTHPLVTRPPAFRSYAGAPISSPEGNALGTVCVLDHRPRAFSDDQIDSLRDLALQAEASLELRRKRRLLREKSLEIRGLIAERERLYFLLSGDIRQVVSIIGAATRMLEERLSEHEDLAEAVADMRSASENLKTVIETAEETVELWRNNHETTESPLRDPSPNSSFDVKKVN